MQFLATKPEIKYSIHTQTAAMLVLIKTRGHLAAASQDTNIMFCIEYVISIRKRIENKTNSKQKNKIKYCPSGDYVIK